MPEVHVPLVHGANEAVDPKLLPDGWLTRAENVRFRKDGRPGSRFGYDFISGSVGRCLAAGKWANKHNVYFTPRTNALPAQWSDRRPDGSYTALDTASSVSDLGVPRRVPAARNFTYMAVASDIAAAGSYLFVVSHDRSYTTASNLPIRVDVCEALSHRPVTTLFTAGIDSTNPKVVTVGTKVLVFFSVESSDAIKCLIIDSVALTTSTATVVTATAGRGFAFDVAPLDASTCLLCYETSGINLRWGTVDTAGTFTAQQNQAIANPVRPSIARAGDGTVAMCWAEGASFTVGNLHYLESTTAGVAIIAKTTLDSSGLVTGYPVAGPGRASGLSHYSLAWNRTDYKVGTFVDAGSAQIVPAMLLVVSKPFITGTNGGSMAWFVNRVTSGDTTSGATYTLMEMTSSELDPDTSTMTPNGEAIACQGVALPGGFLTTSAGSHTYIETRRFVTAVPTVLSAPSSTAFACHLPVVAGGGFGTDIVRMDNGLWVDRLFPTTLNGQLFFSGSRVREFDGQKVYEAGMGTGPEVVTLTNAGAGNIAPGVYQYVVTWEHYDGGGRRHQSPPSLPVTITLSGSSQVTVAAATPTITDRRSYPVVWRTLAGETIFHRLPLTTYVQIHLGVASILGGSSNDNSSDATISSTEVLYTQGERGGLSGLLENAEPVPCRFIWAGNSRLFMGGLEEPSEVRWSKLVFPGEPVQFTDNQGFRGRVDGEVTAICCLDGAYYTATREAWWVFQGDGPDDSGAGGSFGDPRKLPSDVGCISQRSVVEVPQGVLFQGRSDRIYLLPRGGGAPQWVGQSVRDTLALYPFIASAKLIPDSNVVVFACLNSAGTDGVLIVYDTRINEWTVDIPYAAAAATNRAYRCLEVYDGKLVLDGQIAETALYADDESGSQNRAIVEVLAMGDFRPFGPMGSGRVRGMDWLGEFRSASTVTVEVSYDSGVTFDAHVGTWVTAGTAGDRLEREYRLKYVRTNSPRFRLTSTPTSPGEGTVFNAVTLEIYPEKGTPRLGASQRA